MNKISKIALWVLMGVSLVFTVVYFICKGEEGGPTIDAWTYAYLDWAYIMLALTVLLIVILPILTIRERKINFKGIALTLVGIVVIVGGAYLLAPGSAVTLANGTVKEGAVTKFTDTAIFVTYLLVLVTILAIVFGSVYNAVKKD